MFMTFYFARSLDISIKISGLFDKVEVGKVISMEIW